MSKYLESYQLVASNQRMVRVAKEPFLIIDPLEFERMTPTNVVDDITQAFKRESLDIKLDQSSLVFAHLLVNIPWNYFSSHMYANAWLDDEENYHYFRLIEGFGGKLQNGSSSALEIPTTSSKAVARIRDLRRSARHKVIKVTGFHFGFETDTPSQLGK